MAEANMSVCVSKFKLAKVGNTELGVGSLNPTLYVKEGSLRMSNERNP